MISEITLNRDNTEEIVRFGIKRWTISFLNGPGRNPDLARGLGWHANYYVGPTEVALNKLHRIAGPETEMVYRVDEGDWERTVTSYIAFLEKGLQPPPLIAVDFLDDGLAIADGNKRYEAIRRIGIKSCKAILCLSRDPRIYNL